MPTSNRIERASDLVRRAALFDIRFEGSDRTTEFAVAEAKKTLFELFFIVRDLQPPTRTTRRKLEAILRAPDLPVLDDHDKGRDTQAEFFAGAVYRAAGFYVDLGEPDLRIRSGTRVWGVAVKRVKSDQQFAKRVQKAQSQLARQGLYGFIVVNPDVFLARAHAKDPATNMSTVLFDKTGDWVDLLNQDRTLHRVLAVVGLGTSFKLVRESGGNHFEFAVHIHHRFVTNGDPKELAAIDELSKSMMMRLKESLSRLTIPG